MIRTRWFFGQGIFLLLLSLLLTTAATAQTDGTLNVKAREPELLFGESIRFDLTASSMADITSAVLTYRTLNNQAMIVQNLDFAPNDQIELHHTVDLVSNPLKPFVQIEYWWMVSDASGHKVTTASKVFTYKDNRFETWQSLAGQRVTVHWYSGGDEFGIRALGIAEQAVDEIRVMISLSSDISEPFHLYLYASENDLLPALPATGREWVVGQAYPELKLAVATIPPGMGSLSAMHRLLPHELTHLMLYEAMGSSYADFPPWLNEGLAVISEQSPDPDYTLTLEEAVQNDQLLSLDSLCHTFPRHGDQARLAYAQSASITRFIQENYGRSSIAALVAAYSDGFSCRGGVSEALGISLGRLESQWRKSFGSFPGSVTLFQRSAPWLLLILTSIPLLLLAAQPLTSRRGKKSRSK